MKCPKCRKPDTLLPYVSSFKRCTWCGWVA
jgi:hypothetical protein